MKSAVGRLAVLLFIVGGIVAYMTVGVRLFDRVRNSGVRIELTGIDRTFQGARITSGRYPADLAAYLREQCVSRGTKRVGADPWGRDYQFAAAPDGYRIASSGPDRRMGTPDDVVLVREGERLRIETSGGGLQAMGIRNLPAAAPPPAGNGAAALPPGLAALISPEGLRRERPGVAGDDLAAAILAAFGGGP